MALQERALIDHDAFHERIIMHPFVRSYVEQNAILLGEDWDRRHAAYYVDLVEKYQYLPVDRWPEVDTEWGNVYRGADWCAERIDRLWETPALEMVSSRRWTTRGSNCPTRRGSIWVTCVWPVTTRWRWRTMRSGDIRRERLRWLSTGAMAALALGDLRNYAWLLVNIGRHLFFMSRVEEAMEWLKRGAAISGRRRSAG